MGLAIAIGRGNAIECWPLDRRDRSTIRMQSGDSGGGLRSAIGRTCDWRRTVDQQGDRRSGLNRAEGREACDGRRICGRMDGYD